MRKNKTEKRLPMFTDLPYADRRLIVFDPACEKVTEQRMAAPRPAPNQTSLVNAVAEHATDSVLLVTFPALLLAKKGIELGAKALKAANAVDIAATATTMIVTIGRHERDILQFPPGHPGEKIVYVGHPLEPPVYWPLAHFHRFAFEHKVSEAIELIMALGAKTTTVEHVAGWSREMSAHLNIPIPETPVSVSASASATGKSDAQALFKATLRGSEKPELPNGLIWFPHEPTWQQIAKGRLKYGLQDFSLTVNYSDDFGIDASLAAKVETMEFGIGGSFQKHEATVWKIQGTFA